MVDINDVFAIVAKIPEKDTTERLVGYKTIAYMLARENEYLRAKLDERIESPNVSIDKQNIELEDDEEEGQESMMEPVNEEVVEMLKKPL